MNHRRMLIVLLGMVFVFGSVSTGRADIDDFIDKGKIKAKRTKCIKARQAGLLKCIDIDDVKKQKKCAKALPKKFNSCMADANTVILKTSKLPPEAKQVADEIIAKQQKGAVACAKKMTKCNNQCFKKANGDNNAYDKCLKKKKCGPNHDKCIKKVLKKHSIGKSKKLKKILKGKKPA